MRFAEDVMVMHWSRSLSSLLLLLSCCSKTLFGCTQNPTYSDSAVQSYPVTFLSEPESQALAVGDNLTLVCHANVSLLNGVPENVYRMPTIFWRFNGSKITEGVPGSVSTNENTGHSVLVVQNVGHEQAGDYECLVNDANGHFITTSRKAVVQVIENNVVHQLSVSLGQPVQLECGPLLPAGASATWRHDGQELQPSEDSVIFADEGRVLLLVSVDDEDRGSWECVGMLSEDQGVQERQYNITISPGNYSGPPHVLFNTSQSDPREGMPFTLQCLTAPDPDAVVVWLPGEQTSGLFSGITVSESHELVFDTFTSDDAGSYTCAVLDEGEIVAQATIDLQLSATPEFVSKHVTEMYVAASSLSLNLTCSVSGLPMPSIYWIKDGDLLSTDLYDYSTGTLMVTPADVPCGKLHGVYQCFAKNGAGEIAAVTRVLLEGLSNPPTDLVCIAGANQGSGFFQPQIELSWKAPVPDGGQQRVYIVAALDPNNNDLAQMVPSTDYILSVSLEGLYDVFVLVEDSSLPPVFCRVDTYDRYKRQPAYFQQTCQSGTVHLQWTTPTYDPTLDPANNFHVTASCLHGNDSKFYEKTIPFVATFEKDVLTGLPSGALCLFTGSFTIHSAVTNQQEPFTVPTSNCFLDDIPVSDEAIPGNPRLNISCESSTVWLSWDVPDAVCLGIDHVNISGVCLNETWKEEYYMKVDVDSAAGGVLVFPSVPAGSICSFTGFFFGENETVEIVAPVQCIVDEHSPAAYVLLDKNFTRMAGDCTPESTEQMTGTEEALSTMEGVNATERPTKVEEDSATNEVTTVDQLFTTVREMNVAADVSVLIGMLILTSIVLPCSLAGVLIGVMVLYLRKRRMKQSLLEMEVSAYKSTIKWSSHYDDGDTTSIKTNLDAVFPDELFQENLVSATIPIYNLTLVDQFGVPVRQGPEEVIETLSSTGKTELQSEDEVSLDPTERWSSPVEKRPGNDSGCFLVTDRDGLSQAVSKEVIPEDKTGSSGFWSESSAPQGNMQSYHESLAQDLAEAECRGKSQSLLPNGKALGGSGCPLSIINTDSCSYPSVKNGQETTAQQVRGPAEVESRTSVSCVVVEMDSGTCIRVSMDQKRSPMPFTTIPTVHKSTGAETVDESNDSRSLGSSMETLSQSSGSNEYINQTRHHLVHPDSSEVQSNLLYTDGKGYLRFVTKTSGTEVATSAK